MQLSLVDLLHHGPLATSIFSLLCLLQMASGRPMDDQPTSLSNGRGTEHRGTRFGLSGEEAVEMSRELEAVDPFARSLSPLHFNVQPREDKKESTAVGNHDSMKSIQKKGPRVKNIDVTLIRSSPMVDENSEDPFDMNAPAPVAAELPL